MIRTPTYGFSMWLLGLLGWVPRASIQRGREGGNKEGRESGPGVVYPFMTQPQKLYSITFSTFSSLAPVTKAGSCSEGGEFDLTFWWEKCQRFGGTCFKTILNGFSGSSLKDSDSMYLGWDPGICVFNKYPSDFYLQGSLRSTGNRREGLTNSKPWTWT